MVNWPFASPTDCTVGDCAHAGTEFAMQSRKRKKPEKNRPSRIMGIPPLSKRRTSVYATSSNHVHLVKAMALTISTTPPFARNDVPSFLEHSAGALDDRARP